MRLLINELKEVTNRKLYASMVAGELAADAILIFEPIDGDTVGFNFDEHCLFSLILHYCGLDRRFNEDVFRVLNGESLELPLDYGEADTLRIAQAVARSRRL